MGEYNQAQGIKNKLKNLLVYQNTTVIEKEWHETRMIVMLKETITKNKLAYHIVLGMGSHGLAMLREISSEISHENIITIWAGHQIFTGLEDAINLFNLITLPSYAVNDDFQKKFIHSKTKLVKTYAVAHNMDYEQLDSELMQWKTMIPKAKHYMGVILGGDADEKNGTMRCFEPNEAIKLANTLIALNKENPTFFLISNSNRTGRYHPVTKEIMNHHTKNMVDQTSQALLDALNKASIAYQFFNYTVNQSSAYKAILGQIRQSTKNAILVTGDSSMMISEIVDLLPDNAIYIAKISSMNETHHANIKILKSFQKMEKISLNSEAIKLIKIHPNQKNKQFRAIYSAAAVIAHEVKKLIPLNDKGEYHEK